MILPRPADALHKAWLYRLLIGLIDNSKINREIYFKGGTCASMLDFLDRFSVGLDFDLDGQADKVLLRRELHQLFGRLGLKIKDESQRALQFFLKYPSVPGKRNTIKLDIIDMTTKTNKYSPQYLKEIDRFMNCQTIETMFANKLVTVIDRFEKSKTRPGFVRGVIAGRDVYDVHYFFGQGFDYDKEIIKERTGLKPKDYFKKLQEFIDKKVTQKILEQDLNTLLPKKKFSLIRKVLKLEVLMFIKDEIERLGVK